MKVWIVGISNPDNYKEWVFRGVFDDEETALGQCENGDHFIGPATLNEKLPIEPGAWPGACYPHYKGVAE